MSMPGSPAGRALIDLDCAELPQESKHCDYVLVVASDEGGVVAPIELKSGGFKVSEVEQQLQGGADQASAWLPRGEQFRFIPILVHGKGIRRPELVKLRRAKITFGGEKWQVTQMRCGRPVKEKLSAAQAAMLTS